MVAMYNNTKSFNFSGKIKTRIIVGITVEITNFSAKFNIGS